MTASLQSDPTLARVHWPDTRQGSLTQHSPGFTESVDRFYSMIEQGKVYFISRCQLKTANKQYTHIKNDYEMSMGNDTSIIECTETGE